MIKKIDKGLVYKGSKRKLAFDLLSKMYELVPNATHFYDMFGGGGSMSLAACNNNYKTHYNELDSNVYKIVKYLAKIKELPKEFLEFMSRDEYRENLNRLKNNTAEPLHIFRALIYSYGSDIYKASYLYRNELVENRSIENLHNLIVHNSKESATFLDEYFVNKNSIGLFEFLHATILPSLNIRERRLKIVGLIKKLELIGLSGLRDLFICDNVEETYSNLDRIKQTDLLKIITSKVKLTSKPYKDGSARVEGFKELEHLDRIGHLEKTDRINSVLYMCNKCVFTNLDYKEVEITSSPKDTIIYCDIPYKDTDSYNVEFNHDEFYVWCIEKAKQGYNVFISEYNMPENMFKCVFEKQVYNMLGYEADEKGMKVMKLKTEKLFIPKI